MKFRIRPVIAMGGSRYFELSKIWAFGWTYITITDTQEEAETLVEHMRKPIRFINVEQRYTESA